MKSPILWAICQNRRGHIVKFYSKEFLCIYKVGILILSSEYENFVVINLIILLILLFKVINYEINNKMIGLKSEQ